MAFTDHFTTLSIPNLGLVRFPEITVSFEDRTALGVKPNASNRTILRMAAWKGYLALRDKGAFDGIDEAVVIARFKTEFETFDKTGVCDYLLLVWDINRWCDHKGIARGYGRGSAGGSLTLYCLGVVRVNPLKHNLDFPRFISEARMKPVVKDGLTYVDGKSAPDIDCDYEYLRRNEVVHYIEERFPGRTSKISTRLDLTGKMALKDVLKIYRGLDDVDAKVVSDYIDVKYGKVQGLHEAAEKNEQYKEWLAQSAANREIHTLAVAIEGLAVAKGQHPSGVGISFEPLDGNVPLEISRAGEVVTSYDMETVAGILIKLDILGLRTIDLVAGTAALAGISLDSIDINDPLIYSSLPTHDKYLGLFQISDGLTKQAARHIKPRNVDELAAVLAISRPGALAYIDQFAQYVKTGEIKPFYPPIDEILKSTGGALIMQEQITQICRDVFGMSGVDADSVRYAVGKKKREEMEKWEPVIQANGRDRGIPEMVIKSFWETCSASADYQFNLSHSVLYASLCAATIYLKAKYPLEFYLTMLKLAREEPNSIEYMNDVIAEARSVDIRILPPDIVQSESDFSIQDGAIRFGLSSIKGVSELTMGKITGFRRAFDTRFQLFEAAHAARIPINVLCYLIYSGCLDTKGTPRSYYALNAQLYNLLTDREKPLVHKLAPRYNEDLITMLKEMPALKDEKGKPLIRETRLNTLRRDYEGYWKMYEQNSQNEELTSYLFERTLLGFSYTATLHQCYSRHVVGLVPVDAILAAGQKEGGGKSYSVVCFIEEFGKHTSRKNGTPYAKLIVRDDTASMRVMVYGEEKLKAAGRLNEGDLIIVHGNLSKDGSLIFAESVVVQPNPVIFKRTDIESS